MTLTNVPVMAPARSEARNATVAALAAVAPLGPAMPALALSAAAAVVVVLLAAWDSIAYRGRDRPKRRAA